MLQLIDVLPAPWCDALRGAIMGDALGVPHEFKSADRIPVSTDIDMVMPPTYLKSHPAVPYATWSDDGSQMLALLEALMAGKGTYRSERFLANLLAWWNMGDFQAGGRAFDIGRQTREALECRGRGRPLKELPPHYCGNGSLMRVLPVATLPDLFGVSQDDAIHTAMAQSDLTHPQLIARVTCALYVELCWQLASYPVKSVCEAVLIANDRLRARGLLTAAEVTSLDALMAFQRDSMPTGHGYVVNTFWSAIWACSKAENLSSALRAAVGFGNDTDTVACVAGGLASLCTEFDLRARQWWCQVEAGLAVGRPQGCMDAAD